MKKRSRNMLLLITGILLIVIGMTAVYFNIPYSKTRTEFAHQANLLLEKTAKQNGVFTEQDIAGLPLPVQRYFKYCGYIGTPKMSSMKASFTDVDFILDKTRRVKIDYTQYNFVHEPNRIAYIDSSMYGIPFEGLDAYIDGHGSMKGILAKSITLFDQTGPTMDKASLVTFLSECLLVPNAALQDYITWEAVDDLHARATISYYGISASGMFTFNENGEAVSFTTDDREAVTSDGRSEKVRWSAILQEYKESGGIRKPTVLQAIWHYDGGDLTYFNSRDAVIEHDYNADRSN
ncbi:MAG: DUF6544 family protein [Syntrophomonadaceae bacterium]